MLALHRGIKRLARQLEIFLGGAGESPARDGVLQNVAWLLADRGWRLVAGFSVGVVVARALGPASMGVLVSALALVTLSTAVVELGLDAILRRELVNAAPERRGELLASAALLRLASVPVGALTILAALALPGHAFASPELLVALLVAAPLPVFQGFDSWFQSQTQARYTVWAQNAAFVAASTARTALAFQGATPLAFVWVSVGEIMLTGFALTWLFRRTGQSFVHWRAHRRVAAALWRDAWPFAVINLAAIAYSRVDVLMLAAWRGDTEAGVYGVASRLTELGLVLPGIVISTLLPTLARLREIDRPAYHARVQYLCTLTTWLCLALALGLTLIAPWFIHVTYGPAFAGAAPVVAISAWSIVFAMQGAARGQWLLLENLQRFGLWYVLMGCLTNVTLNALLIPPFGAIGAAIAAVCTQAVVALVAPLAFRPTRPGVWLLLNAFVFRRTRL
jgi:PST family polysaccharide transporter